MWSVVIQSVFLWGYLLDALLLAGRYILFGCAKDSQSVWLYTQKLLPLRFIQCWHHSAVLTNPWHHHWFP